VGVERVKPWPVSALGVFLSVVNAFVEPKAFGELSLLYDNQSAALHSPKPITRNEVIAMTAVLNSAVSPSR
jgi:hypothetical protein